MDRNALKNFCAWFDGYVKAFYSNDAEMQVNIELKEKHTKKVCDNILALGHHLKLGENGLRLAETAALFHDVGRFEQYRRYRTFSDLKSENHAEISVRILKTYNVLAYLDDNEKNLILKAVEYHNILELPTDMEEETLLYCKMLRDADKLDSYDVVVNYYEGRDQRQNQVLEDFPDHAGYTSSVVGSLIRGENVSYRDARTLNDRKMTYLAWLFDINYSFTIKEVKRRDYIDRLFRLLPKEPDIELAHCRMNDYLEKRLAGV